MLHPSVTPATVSTSKQLSPVDRPNSVSPSVAPSVLPSRSLLLLLHPAATSAATPNIEHKLHVVLIIILLSAKVVVAVVFAGRTSRSGPCPCAPRWPDRSCLSERARAWWPALVLPWPPCASSLFPRRRAPRPPRASRPPLAAA